MGAAPLSIYIKFQMDPLILLLIRIQRFQLRCLKHFQVYETPRIYCSRSSYGSKTYVFTKKGVRQIVVTIEYFADYSFKVTAEDEETKVSQTAVFESGFGKPSKDTLDQILETAKKFKSQEEVIKKLDLFRTYDGVLSQFESQYSMSPMLILVNMINRSLKLFLKEVRSGLKKTDLTRRFLHLLFNL